MHMCDELAAFERQATCMRNRMGRRTNGAVRHACQHGSAVVETICRRSSITAEVAEWIGFEEGQSGCLAY